MEVSGTQWLLPASVDLMGEAGLEKGWTELKGLADLLVPGQRRIKEVRGGGMKQWG